MAITKPFPAQYRTICHKCKNPIEIGQLIRWSRIEKDKRGHEDCANPWIKLEETATGLTSPVYPTDDIESLRAAIAEAEAKLAAETTKKAGLETAIATLDDKATAVKSELAKLEAKLKPYPTTWYDTLEALIEAFRDTSLRVLLIGPPGTGKSTTSINMMDSPYRITMTEGDGIEDYIGLWNLKDGETVWLNGIVSEAMLSGKKVLIDEIDHHPAEIGSSLYGWLDDKPHVRTPKGIIYATAGYGVIGTTNSNVTSLPDAILDRFEAVIPACVPHPAAVASWAEPEKACTLNYFNNLDKTPWTWAGKPTLRRMAAFRRMRPIIGEQCAAASAFGSAAKEILSTLSTSARS